MRAPSPERPRLPPLLTHDSGEQRMIAGRMADPEVVAYQAQLTRGTLEWTIYSPSRFNWELPCFRASDLQLPAALGSVQTDAGAFAAAVPTWDAPSRPSLHNLQKTRRALEGHAQGVAEQTDHRILEIVPESAFDWHSSGPGGLATPRRLR